MIPQGIEKHIVTVMVTIITALLCWIGYTTQQTAVGVAELRVEIRGVSANTDRIERLESRVFELERR